jgi:hypothetical protein
LVDIATLDEHTKIFGIAGIWRIDLNAKAIFVGAQFERASTATT